jgi:hypothetical protein
MDAVQNCDSHMIVIEYKAAPETQERGLRKLPVTERSE